MNEWFDAERHVARADELSESGQWDAAAHELRLAVEKVPDQDDWQFHLGLALERIEQFDGAARVFEEVVRLRGDDFEALLHLGINRVWSGDARGAVEALDHAEKIDPDRHESFCFRIAAYADLELPEQAELMFYRAQQIGDDCPACYEHLGASLIRKGELRKAAWCWQQSVKLEPERRHLHRLLGQAYWQLGELELARHFLELTLKDDPTDAEALLSMGVVLVELGQASDATEKLRWAVEIVPDLAVGHVYLGELAMLRGDIPAARARFERAREIEPLFPGVSAGLARVALAEQKEDAARELALAELDAPEHSPVQRLDLGRLLLELNLPRESFEVLDELVLDVREDEGLIRLLPDVLLARGAALALQGMVREGLRDMRDAASLDPEHPVAAQSVGMVLHSLGQPWRAAAWLTRAQALEPDNREVARLCRRSVQMLTLSRVRRAVRRFFRR